jgi:DNA-directed RNA polymerase specialized sigma24 family protein
MALPKWTDERTQQLVDSVGTGPVSQETVKSVALELETSTRSVSSKLRKMGHEVELASAVSTKSFSDAQESTLEAFVTDNSGQYTYAEIASSFEDGHFSAKSIQGKILSMELTSHVKPAEKQESVRTYSPDEETTFVSMVNGGSFVEEIADALGKSVNSIRGKALSLLRSGDINAIPKQKETKGSSKADPLADISDIDTMSVEDIADNIGKTVRGVKTMLTRRGLTCADYDGAARKEKASS